MHTEDFLSRTSNRDLSSLRSFRAGYIKISNDLKILKSPTFGRVWKLRKTLIIAVCALDHIKRTLTQEESGSSAIVATRWLHEDCIDQEDVDASGKLCPLC